MVPDVPTPAHRWRAARNCLWLKGSRWLCLLLLTTLPAAALEVRQVVWGYDGQVMPGRFSLVSVLVANLSEVPFDGAVDFYKGRGLELRVGAIYRAPCYLSPRMTRWLQFYVLVDNSYDQWRLEWGRSPKDSLEVKPPKWGPPAQVLLSDPESAPGAGSLFKEFPEELFPATVAATRGLDSLLLDHAPRWEPAKRQAFLDWLRTGGKVHLLKMSDGRYPVFADELGVLNSAEERLRIGAGLVTRHAATARELRQEDIPAAEMRWRNLKPNEMNLPEQTAELFLRVLSRFSQRHYNWSGIYALALFYAVLIGPGNLWAGRKLTDYRLRILVLLGTIAGFAVLFHVVARRGLGETSVVHSLSYARAIEGDRYDVMQWANVFAAHGTRAAITHDAPHNLYATAQDYEPVNGWIESGKDGRFAVDMPMFSRRAFLHAGEMKGPRAPVRIVRWEGGESMTKLVLSVDPDFRKEMVDGWVVQGDQIYPMKTGKDDLEFDGSFKQALYTFAADAHSQSAQTAYGRVRRNGVVYNQAGETQVTNVVAEFQELARPLLVWSFGPENLTQLEDSAPAADGRVRLYLFARSPRSFGVTGSDFGRETGYVLYQFDLFKP